jgi:hypothetical protein
MEKQMATKNILICDGCDKEEVSIPSTPCPTIRPVLVSFEGGSDNSYDLCYSCRDILLKNINPKEWSRPARPA